MACRDGRSSQDCPLAAIQGGWNYCSDCGSLATEVKLDIDNEHNRDTDGDGDLIMDAQGRADFGVTLVGRHQVYFEVTSPVDGITVGPPQYESGRATVAMSMLSVPDGELVDFEVISWDGPRKDLWSPDTASMPKGEARVNGRRQSTKRRVRRQDIKLYAEPEVLVFHPRLLEREIRLVNEGNTPVWITPTCQGRGFSFTDASILKGFQLKASYENSVLIQVRSDPSYGRGGVVFKPEFGEAVSIRCLANGPAAPVAAPARVIAIDFGTSNTSVFCADPATDQVDALPLAKGGNNRVETILRVRTDRGAWEALKEIDLADYEGVVRGLKSVVRGKEDTVVVDGVGTIRVHDLLTFYLKSLRTKKVDPYLRNAVEPGDWVEFIFTVPVLDGEGGTERTRYEERLRRAARSAGFEDPERNWSIEVMPEPDGGLWDILTNESTSKSFRSGERVLVVDCGGGTTDLTLAQIHINGRTPTLTEHRNSSAESGGSGKQIQFGGNVVTYNLGIRWITDVVGAALAGETDEHQRNALRDGLLERLRGFYGREQGQLSGRPGADSYETYFDRMLKGEGPSHMDVRCWFFRYFRLFDYLEKAKREISDTNVEQATFRDQQDSEQRVARVQLTDALAVPLSQVTTSIQDFLLDSSVEPEEIAHVVLIGGSARLPQLRDRLQILFDERRICYVTELLDTAVCRGAARSRSIPVRPIPIGVSRKDVAGRVLPLTRQGQVLRIPIPNQYTITVDAHGKAEYTLLAVFNDEVDGKVTETSRVLHRFPLGPGYHKIQTVISETGAVAEHFDASGRAIDLFKYEF